MPLLCVVHLGEDYVVVDKPAGLLSVPGRGPDKFDSVSARVRIVFPQATGSISVHRLDMDTSGLMVLGLTGRAHRGLSRQFEARKIGKTYIALLDGIVKEDEGAVDLPLVVDWPNRPRQKVDHELGKPSRTLYRVISRTDTTTRVEFRPLTGRTHQLRVHAAAPRNVGGLGCPILGDTLYGDPASADRLLLHADHLAFWEPLTGEWRKFNSPPPF
ncbi:MAG: RluA family pseudouridine synthase [Phycisphaerales bacterium]|nr:RluA family pseudouridine synthase [Phycisphaerales bacterium]